MTGHQGELARRTWDAVCRHIDGMAIGSTMAALAERGALKILAGSDRTRFTDLCRELEANAGFLHVAIRLLADQGWVVPRGDPDIGELAVEPTDDGRAVFTEFAHAYPAAARFLPAAGRMNDMLGAAGGDEILAHYAGLMRREWDLPSRAVPRGARQQVLAHLNGHLLAPLMLAMTQGGMLSAGTEIRLGGRLLQLAAGILAWQGWAQTSGDTAWLTPEGELAVSFARQYRYPLVYLPLLRRVPELIFGDPEPAPASAAETHLDRELDVRFSGDVFSAMCRRPFLDIARPLFNRLPLAGQPAMVVDMGCGDGTVLAALHAAVRSGTERGRVLGDHPLLMVGVDPSPVAREITASRLSAAGIPHVVLDGDIADPERLRRDLAERGLNAGNALHICKSAIHDRAYREPDAPAMAGSGPPVSYGAFALADGSDVSAAKIAVSLADIFRSWRPLTRKHGWLVIEAHAAPPAAAARLIGRTIATALDSTHGYSCQYPVEPQVFAWAAQSAGYSSQRHAEPGAAQLGHTVLTIDHFTTGPAPGRRQNLRWPASVSSDSERSLEFTFSIIRHLRSTGHRISRFGPTCTDRNSREPSEDVNR
ncbi:MAG TPA: class I SAM-dependent methyltransferase [Streptosporangiaceae bacterium]|jgi:SAM-dependent methyltransferase